MSEGRLHYFPYSLCHFEHLAPEHKQGPCQARGYIGGLFKVLAFTTRATHSGIHLDPPSQKAALAGCKPSLV